MSRKEEGKIACQCGNLVDVTFHYSVNIRLNPELKKSVLERKINNYFCEKCGAKMELAFQFLYVDDRNKKWIWCYPEQMQNDKKNIREKIDNNPSFQSLNSMGAGLEQSLVFGYDELIKKINLYDSDN